MIGLPYARGLPVAVDASMISPVHADGTAWAQADRKPGTSFGRARRAKLRTYPELRDSHSMHLVVAATEVGGRVSKEALELLDAAAASRAQDEPRVLRAQAARSWRARWVTMLAVSAQDSLAATLVSEGVKTLDAASGPAPTSIDVWLDGAYFQ